MKTWLIRIAVGGARLMMVLVVVLFLVYYFTAPSERTLHPRLKEATRVVVRSGGLCHRSPANQKVFFVVDDSKKIQELIQNIQISEIGSGLMCMCCGGPTFEFYRGPELLAGVSLHHRRSLRWEGWYGDGLLTEASSTYITILLKCHGLTDKDFQ